MPIVHHAGTAEVLYNLQALAAFVRLKSKVIRNRPAARGVQVSALHPLGILQSIKDKHANQPAKNARQPSACVIAPWMGTNHFQQYMYAQDVLGNVTERVM